MFEPSENQRPKRTTLMAPMRWLRSRPIQLLLISIIMVASWAWNKQRPPPAPPPPDPAATPVKPPAGQGMPGKPAERSAGEQLKTIGANMRRSAFMDAKFLALVYARADERAYPGISRFGRTLAESLDKVGWEGRLSFESLVSKNPEFWRAEREITRIDPSLPYLVAMLAVLSDDPITASRMLALAQATLPLTPSIRRVYARPEGVLRYQDKILLRGLPLTPRIQTVEESERASLTVRQRIGLWPDRLALLAYLLDLETKRMSLVKTAPAGLEVKLAAQLKLTPDDLKHVSGRDPILAEALQHSARDWLGQMTLAQQWIRWMDESDPAETADLEKSIAVYETAAREDLAWLTWRHALVVKGVVNEKEQQRWQGWAKKLLGAEAADRLIADIAANPKAGTASMPVPFERNNEVWSGDQGMHPLLAIKFERELAYIDAQMPFVRNNAKNAAMLQFQRAEKLLQVGALPAARAEYEQAIKVVEAKIGEPMLALILTAEQRHDEAGEVFRRILQDPAFKRLRSAYAACLFNAGDYKAARREFRECAQNLPDNDYSAIMAELAARREGSREPELLHAARQKLLVGSWTAAGIRYLQSEITADELMTAAREGTAYTVVQHECEGSFWIAQVALAEGRTEEGVQWLRRCLATGFTSFIEYAAAKAELKRLRPEEAAPRRESAPRDARRSIAT